MPFTGSSVISPTQSGCCTLAASNEAGSDQKTACITILPPKVTRPKATPTKPTAPIISNFSASCPKESFAAIACTLNWSVTGSSGTTVSISGLCSVGPSGSSQVKGGSYTLTATSAGGSATRTVQVK